MISATDYARQLDSALELVGNDLGALERLNAALALMPDYDDNGWDSPEYDDIVSIGAPSCREETFDDQSGFEPNDEDWQEYCEYLDRLDAEREYPPIESPRWTAWTQWLRTPEPVPDGELTPSAV